MGSYKSLVGLLFKYLTVIEDIGRTPNGTVIYKCLCKCGKETTANSNSLKTGTIKSCGCLNQERIDSKPFKTHGLSKTRLYKIWTGMNERCYSKNSTSYSRYGAIGIKVCDRWRYSFDNFYEDMKDGYEDNLTIERKISTGNYEKSNCTWATYKEQNRNRKNVRFLEVNGLRKRLVEWCDSYNIKPSPVRFRIDKLKWQPLAALTTPSNGNWKTKKY